MKYDIVLCFLTPDAGRVTGFLTAEPIPESLEEVTAARDQIQQRLGSMQYLTVFTRDPDPIVANGANPTAMEITLPSGVLEKSVMISQIIEVAE
jgi:hypothetical protein